jgi:CRP-like cAMP-binding protein
LAAERFQATSADPEEREPSYCTADRNTSRRSGCGRGDYFPGAGLSVDVEEKSMATIEELKRIYLLSHLSNEMLEKIIPEVRLLQFREKEVVFKVGQTAEYFYMLKGGKILLEVQLLKGITISLGSLKSGYSFGWSALVSGSAHASSASCLEPCEVLAIPGDKLRSLLEENHTMGYRIMEFTAKVLKNRLERRTEQLLKVLSKHPDMQKLLSLRSDDEMSEG